MARRLYTLLLWLLLPLMLLRLFWRGRKLPGYRHNVLERLGFYRTQVNQPLIWLHAVSVGETRAAAPLVQALKQRFPDHSILLTHMTPTGRETGRQLFGDGVVQTYLPYDYPIAIRRFLRHFRPTAGLLLETELWPNLAYVCKRQNTPLLLVNARLSERSARGYRRVRALIQPALASLAGLAAQTSEDALRLEQLGAPSATITGNLKFDIAPPEELVERGRAWRNAFGDRAVWLAASTRDGEEELIFDMLEKLADDKALLILVPRHPQRFEEVAKLAESRGLKVQRRSQTTVVEPATQIWLGDSMGEMYAYYAASDLAVIGGSILPFGGQNLIEACAVGTPVLLGEHTENFADVARQAIEAGAALRVQQREDWPKIVAELLTDAARRQAMGQAGQAFAARHRGATERTMAHIMRLLSVG